MKEEQHQFLRLLGQIPARLTAEQTAWVLNCQAHDVPVLVAARLLKPLGNPMANSVKYFATVEILELAKDRTWLAKATNAVGQNWKERNLQRKSAALHSPASHSNCRIDAPASALTGPSNRASFSP